MSAVKAKGKPMTGYQNRASPADAPEDFPTPPWATRALIEHVMAGGLGMDRDALSKLSAWEPAANRGYMARPLGEVFGSVLATDKHDYGMGYPMIDFLEGPSPKDHGMDVHWIVTNPPFNLGAKFVERVPIVRGRVDEKASTAMPYAWFLWDQQKDAGDTLFQWIEPCRKELEREGDYEVFGVNPFPDAE